MELTDDALLRRMIAGDEEAFAVLYRRRHPSIYRFALHMSGNAGRGRGRDARGVHDAGSRRQTIRSHARDAERVSLRRRAQSSAETLGAGPAARAVRGRCG